MITVVYHLHPTSNRNVRLCCLLRLLVVYHLHPTSNRNVTISVVKVSVLYIIFILHQTATDWQDFINDAKLYIIFILHQPATSQ